MRERLAPAPAKKEAPRRQPAREGASPRSSEHEGVGTLATRVREVIGTAGMPLDPAVSQRMEARFAHDFSRVRVHADAPAAASAEALSARAYTTGEHLVFARGAYSPSTVHGQRLIAHELAHVAQSGHRGLGPAEELRVSAPDSAEEQSARAASQLAVRGAQVSPTGSSPSGANVFRDNGDGGTTSENDAIAAQLIFAHIGPKSMDGILKRLNECDSEELSKLRENSALAEPYGRERLELAMKVVWFSKFGRATLAEMRPSLQAEIDRVVPDATHHDQHEALINFMNQAKAQPSSSTAAAAPAPAPAGKGKKAPAPPPPLPAARKMSSVTIDAAKIAALDKVKVQADYDMLMGKTKTKGMSGDLPFEGAGSGRWRDPKRGFLSIRKEVAESLQGEGLRWGATDFPGASGDVMHFDDSNRHGDYVTYGKSHPTEKGKAKKGG